MIVFARGLSRRVIDSISIILSILADDTKPSCVVAFRTISFVHFAQCTCSDISSLEQRILNCKSHAAFCKLKEFRVIDYRSRQISQHSDELPTAMLVISLARSFNSWSWSSADSDIGLSF